MRLTLAYAFQSSVLALLLAAPTALLAQDSRPIIGPELPPSMRPPKEDAATGTRQLNATRGSVLDNSADANVPAGTVLGPNMRPGVVAEAALAFESTFIDFGDMDEGKTAAARFPFINTSDRTITITNTHTTCGCTVATLDKKIFAPGEGDVVEIAFNSTGRPGLNDRLIRIVTDEPGVTSYALRLRANVTQEVWLSQRVAAFGEVPVGESRSITVNLLSIADDPIEIVDLINTRGEVTAQLGISRPYVIPGKPEPGVQIPITITIPGDRGAGRMSGNIAIKTNQPGRHQDFSIIYSANVVGTITYSPARLYFGVVPPNSKQMTRGSIAVTTGDDPFELESWEILPLILANAEKPVTPPETLPKLTIALDEPVAGTNVQGLNAIAEVAEHLGHLQGTLALHGKVGEKKESVRIPFSLYVRDLPALQQQDRTLHEAVPNLSQQRQPRPAPGS